MTTEPRPRPAIPAAIRALRWVLFALLLRSTRSMFAVVVSHAVANLALGIYIVSTGNWQYW